jgi:hypothetical protein
MASQMTRTIGLTAARWFIDWEDAGSRGYPKSVTQVQRELATVNPRFSTLSDGEIENAIALMWEVYHAVRSDGLTFAAAQASCEPRYMES